MRAFSAACAGIVGLGMMGAMATEAAATVYSYVGEPFQEVEGDFTTSDRLLITFETTAPLGADFGDDISDTSLLRSWRMSDGLGSLGGDGDFLVQLAIVTDDTGEFVSWLIGAESPDGRHVIVSFQVDGSVAIDGAVLLIDDVNGSAAANYFTPGSWTVTPVPAALPLRASGMVAMAGLHRWRRRERMAA